MSDTRLVSLSIVAKDNHLELGVKYSIKEQRAVQ
jgi:hypothetical protein